MGTSGYLLPTDERRWGVLLPALPLLVVCLAGTRGAGEEDATSLSPWAYPLAALAALTLLLRRRAPRTGTAVAALATAAYLLLEQPYGPVLFVGPAWAWCLATVRPLREVGLWVLGYLVLVLVADAPALLRDEGWAHLLVRGMLLALALGAGAAAGAALLARSRSEAEARAQAAQRAASEERLSMAQDVHDGVGHSLAVIALQAGVARHVLDRDPERAKELLDTVVSTSREALDGLRAELEQMRTPRDIGARRPLPGLADLPPLLDRMRDAGLRIDATIEELPMPAGVGAACYRIVQESLTNVLRHSGSDEATVVVRRTPPAGLLVEVVDRGRGATGALQGNGIVGMCRRAEETGGTLTTGPRDGGGFVVRARWPA